MSGYYYRYQIAMALKRYLDLRSYRYLDGRERNYDYISRWKHIVVRQRCLPPGSSHVTPPLGKRPSPRDVIDVKQDGLRTDSRDKDKFHSTTNGEEADRNRSLTANHNQYVAIFSRFSDASCALANEVLTRGMSVLFVTDLRRGRQCHEVSCERLHRISKSDDERLKASTINKDGSQPQSKFNEVRSQSQNKFNKVRSQSQNKFNKVRSQSQNKFNETRSQSKNKFITIDWAKIATTGLKPVAGNFI